MENSENFISFTCTAKFVHARVHAHTHTQMHAPLHPHTHRIPELPMYSPCFPYPTNEKIVYTTVDTTLFLFPHTCTHWPFFPTFSMH